LERKVDTVASEYGARDSAGLLEYIRILGRRKVVFMQAVVLVPLVAVLFSLWQTKRFEARAEVLLSNQNLAASLTGTPVVGGQVERIAQTQASLARVPLVAARALAAVGLSTRPSQDLLANSDVSARSNADLLDFRVTDEDRALAARLATAYAREFIAYRRELDTGALKAAQADLESEIAQLEAAGERESALYASLVDKKQQLETLEALQTSNAFLVRPAEGAAQVAPKPLRNGLLGLLLGVVLGGGLVFLFEAIDTRVRSVEEIGERLRLPLLARLPTPPRGLRKRNRLVMVEEPNGLRAEAFRILRTNLELATIDRETRTIMFTSAVEGEGKTTTAANLALAFASSGRRVVLVDLDLRHPTLGGLFGREGQPGLTDVALGEVELDDALAEVNVGHELRPRDSTQRQPAGLLEVLPSGPAPPNADEFLNMRVLEDILTELRDRADLVLIDAPPLLRVGDAIGLSAKVEGLILVARLNTIRRSMLAELERLLSTSPANLLGFVATGVPSEKTYGYGGYGGYYPRDRLTLGGTERMS
jgi:capsular exopolysaccharide synthesis family protein